MSECLVGEPAATTAGDLSGDPSGDPATGLLDQARAAKHAELAATAEQLALAARWCDLHPAESIHDAAAYARVKVDGVERAVPIAGPGAPLVAEFCLAELGAALSIRSEAARDLAGQALELRHRLPRCWARVMDLTLPAWRARRIAAATMHLSIAAVAFVDAQISHFAHQVGPAALERLIDDAVQKFMPDLAETERQKAADQRHVDVDTRSPSFAGTAKVFGELDLADAIDLDTALNTHAAALADAGCTESLDVRRAIAMGDLARGQQPLPVDASTEQRSGGLSREVVLHVHTTTDAIEANTPNADANGERDLTRVARVETRGRHLLTLEQIRLWCGGAATITIRPVIDCTESIHVEAYEIPDRISAQAAERDLTCVFPWCTRPAKLCDDDHVIPHSAGGPTETGNIAKLCRSHHRLKTHGGWTYHCLDPGTYLWTSPHGLTLRRGPEGSERLT